jgi:predicted enzyme related to lactoylglutathione lyase
VPTRDHAPTGAPCWADLWTSEVDGSRRFYAEVFGWKADEPDPAYGGYWMFNREGVPVGGGMGPIPGMGADNRWKPYLASEDLDRTLAAAQAHGAQVVVPAMPVGEAGVQAVLTDPTGAAIGIWQPRQFPGFTVLGEEGTPSWFELHTPGHGAAVAFYRDVFGWQPEVVSDTDDFRYTVMRDPNGGAELAGIMDATGFLPEGAPSQWWIYWHVASVDDAIARVTAAGGSVLQAAEDTPYGRLAAVADPAGAGFRLHTPNR